MFFELPIKSNYLEFFSSELEITHLKLSDDLSIKKALISELYICNMPVFKFSTDVITYMRFTLPQAMAFVDVFKNRQEEVFVSTIHKIREEYLVHEGA